MEEENKDNTIKKATERADYFMPDALVAPINNVKILVEQAKEQARQEERRKIIQKAEKIIEERRCPPGGITDFGRATVDGFNRALNYVKDDILIGFQEDTN